VEPAGAPVSGPSTRRARAGRLRDVEPAVAVLVTGLATLPLADFYAGWWWLAVVGGAVLLGGLLTALALAWRRPWWVSAPVILLALVLWLVATAYAELTLFGLPTPEALAALGVGVVTGVPKMLTVGLPADLTGDLLVAPAILGWVAGAAAVAACLRTTSVTAPAAPPLVVFVAGLLLTASRPAPRLLVTGAVVLAVLVLLLLRSNRLGAASSEGIDAADADAVGIDLAARRWHSTMGRVAFGLPAVAGATALAVAAAWLLPIADGSDRADPRTLRAQPFRLTETLSPLVQLRPQLTGPRTQLFTVTVTNESGGDHRPDRVRIAALDTFDGALWTGTRDFEVAGTTLPGFEPLDAPTQMVRLDVEVDALGQPFLPVVGEPVRLTGTGAAFDRATGTAVITGPAPGPFRYSTVGEVRPQDAATRQALPGDDPADAAATVLPAPPPWVRELADRSIQDRQTPMSQLLALEDMLRRQSYNPAALPGHSYGALKRVLLGLPADRVGNAEQYAAAFAVLARSRGFPTRVAVGYQLRAEQREGDRYTVYSTDAHAWPEVRLEGYGWVAFEPTDARSPVAPQPPRSPDVTLGAADRDVPVLDPRRAGDDEPTVAEVASRVGLGLAVLAGLVLLLAVLVAVAKVARRARRARRGPPAQRVVAAWAEVVDRLQEAGLTVPVSRTTAEVAVDARRSPAAVSAAASIEALAPLVTGAVYAAEEPGEEAAARAWALARTARRDIARSLGVVMRLRGLVDPRTLLPDAPRAGRLRRRRRAEPATRAVQPAGSPR
jgi:transglutaminase-like putative cysteine protease